MPTAAGPNTKGEENLVFAYDLGDISNSYRGEPTINKAGGVHLGFNGARWAKRTEYPQKGALPFKLEGDVYQLISGNNYWGFASNFSPAYNKTYTLSYWYYLSTDSNLGAWHNAFFGVPQGGGSQYTTVSTKTNDTFSIVGTNTWRFGSVNITTNTLVDSYTYLRGTYTAGSSDTLPTGQIYIANFQLEEKSHPTPFTAGTRSATQGLLDLTGNSTIDLTNVSFDSNAQKTFDGTDDYIEISDHNIISETNLTVSYWFKMNWVSSWSPFITLMDSNGTQKFHTWFGSDRGIDFQTSINSVKPMYNASAGTYPNNDYINIVMTINGTGSNNIKCYVNGEYKAQGSVTFNTHNIANLRIGRDPNNAYGGGDLSNLAIYNRALTAEEIKSNFNAIKGRFNIL